MCLHYQAKRTLSEHSARYTNARTLYRERAKLHDVRIYLEIVHFSGNLEDDARTATGASVCRNRAICAMASIVICM